MRRLYELKYLLLSRLFSLIRSVQISPRFLKSPLSVVISLQRLAILVGGTFALIGKVKYFA